MAKEFLSRHGVEYTTKNIQEPGVMDELKARGYSAIPVTFFGDEAVVGFNPAKFAELVEVRQGDLVTESRTGDLIERWDRTFSAWERATRQIPAEKLQAGEALSGLVQVGTLPFPEKAMAARDTRTIAAGTPVDPETLDPEATAAEFAVRRKRFADWASTLTEGDLDIDCDGDFGPVHLSRILEMTLGRQMFHLRRLYEGMRAEAIEPAEPMDETELAEIGDPVKMSR